MALILSQTVELSVDEWLQVRAAVEGFAAEMEKIKSEAWNERAGQLRVIGEKLSEQLFIDMTASTK